MPGERSELERNWAVSEGEGERKGGCGEMEARRGKKRGERGIGLLAPPDPPPAKWTAEGLGEQVWEEG